MGPTPMNSSSDSVRCGIPLRSKGANYSASEGARLTNPPPANISRERNARISQKMVRPAGLEPTTPGLEGRCSIQLSYGRMTNADPQDTTLTDFVMTTNCSPIRTPADEPMMT